MEKTKQKQLKQSQSILALQRMLGSKLLPANFGKKGNKKND